MDNTKQKCVEAGTVAAPDKFYIEITADGPYLVHGNPPINQEVIVPDETGSSWSYRKGYTYPSKSSPIALCRCGASKHKPFCDEQHTHAPWNPNETASRRPLLENAEETDGPTMILADNEAYCSYARFCDSCGRVWNLVQEAVTDEERALVCQQVGNCPSGRLALYDKKKHQVFEPPFKPSIGLIEDPAIAVAGPIWVKGGIRIESADGISYEIRNRVTLCRCGQSANKPFCDGVHASARFTSKG